MRKLRNREAIHLGSVNVNSAAPPLISWVELTSASLQRFCSRNSGHVTLRYSSSFFFSSSRAANTQEPTRDLTRSLDSPLELAFPNPQSNLSSWKGWRQRCLISFRFHTKEFPLRSESHQSKVSHYWNESKKNLFYGTEKIFHRYLCNDAPNSWQRLGIIWALLQVFYLLACDIFFILFYFFK